MKFPQRRRRDIFVGSHPKLDKLRRSDIGGPAKRNMSPLMGLGIYSDSCYKYFAPTELALPAANQSCSGVL